MYTYCNIIVAILTVWCHFTQTALLLE